jgi:decaprenylphospho-beta-D-ribofuranose 2-oxidase
VKIKKFFNHNYSNYKESNCYICYPKNKKDIFQTIDYAKKNKIKILPIGSGLSWYDTIFNSDNIIIDLINYKKKFIFDKNKGELLISSQFKIKDIMPKLNKYGWSLYSIPGGSDVTIGGCIGNDVHGKDSFKYGNFSQNIIEFELVLTNKTIIKCSRFRNSEVFKATVGGLGLIGIITSVKLNLKKISNIYKTNHYICYDYKELIKNLYLNNNDYEYINGWVDIHAKNKKLGQGVIFKSKKVKEDILIKPKNINTLRIFGLLQKFVFIFFVKNNLINIMNFFIFRLFKYKQSNYNDYESVTFPLSSYGVDIKEAISPNSFFEIQVIIKKKELPFALKEFILKCQRLDLSGFVIGIKMHKESKNYLSFSDDGVSINVNQIFNEKNFNKNYKKLSQLHDFVIKKNHKIYIAKDFCLNNKDLRNNYKNFKKFLKVKKKIDKNFLFSSDFYKRIMKK